MAMTGTTLSAPIASGAKYVPLTSGTGLVRGMFIRVDSELMRVEDATTTTLPLVSRGINGTAAVAHDILTDANYGLTTDFPSTVLPSDTVITYGAAGAIGIPANNALILLTGAAANAMTLAAPNLGQGGLRLTIMAETAQAHTVLGPAAGFNSAGSGSEKATFGGAKGDNMIIVAVAGAWNIVTSKNITLGS